MPDRFVPVLLQRADPTDLQALFSCYHRVLLATVDAILDRFRRNRDYPFIDTKIDIFTGRDALRLVGETDIYGRETVYAWIQSRGVEAMCGHAAWIAGLHAMPDVTKQHYHASIRLVVECVIRNLEAIRKRNGGSMFFWMDAAGTPFRIVDGRRHKLVMEPSVCHTSDMFHVKAVAAAGAFLNDADMLAEARRYFARWLQAVSAEKVKPDQQPFDPKNPVIPPPGRHSHSQRMITLGALAMYAQLFGDMLYVTQGLDFIRHILDRHVNRAGHFAGREEYDFIEFIGPGGEPFVQDDAIVCDPGHALEFVGLALKFLAVIRDRLDLTKAQRAFIRGCDSVLPEILLHNFTLGFNQVGGIYKSVDLKRRQPLNSDMPWWSLPETMRAAAFCRTVAGTEAMRRECLEIIRLASNAFLGNYVNPRVHLMAYQTLNASGRPVPVVPATPDLDPGYHTGLSIIDCLQALSPEREA